MKHVAVLMGGWSSERQVSLWSGTACADALEQLRKRRIRRFRQRKQRVGRCLVFTHLRRDELQPDHRRSQFGLIQLFAQQPQQMRGVA